MKLSIVATIIAGAVACSNDLTQAQAQAQAQSVKARAVTQVVSGETVTVTYICGKTFRVTSTRGSINFRWHSYATSSDSGTFDVAHKLPGCTYPEHFFTLATHDSVSVYRESYAAVPVGEGNRNIAPCTPQREFVRLLRAP